MSETDNPRTARRRLRRIGGPLAIVLVTAAVGSAESAPALASSTWSIQQTPSPPGATSAVLIGVSCASASSCTSVGHSVTSSGTQEALAELFDGTNWRITLNPSDPATGSLSGVSCRAANDCTAVGQGSGAPLAEHWNGTDWTLTLPASAAANGSLSGVSCTAADCIAVGQSAGAPLAESSSGNSWSVQPVPLPGGANGGSLTSISCGSPTSCLAVGYATSSYCIKSGGMSFCTNRPELLAETWNGILWSIAPAPVPPRGTMLNQKSVLSGVSCFSTTACAAVGTYTGLGTGANGGTLAEYWNGTAWYMYNAGSPYWNMTSFSGGGTLSGVSCPTVASCNATGQANNAALAEVYEGMTTWMVQLPPTPSGATSSILSGVSCPGFMDCISVGKYVASSGADQPLTERLTG